MDYCAFLTKNNHHEDRTNDHWNHKNKVDKIWTDIWAGGLTNPLTVIEQLTYLLFIRSLDEKELDNERMDALMGTKERESSPRHQSDSP